MKLNKFDGSTDLPDSKTLENMVMSYRAFVGARAAFHIEYSWWPGQFETRDEEIDFNLNEFAWPENYEVIDRWHDEAIEKLAACEIDAMDTRSSRNLWRVTAIILLIPYLVLWYLYESNS